MVIFVKAAIRASNVIHHWFDALIVTLGEMMTGITAAAQSEEAVMTPAELREYFREMMDGIISLAHSCGDSDLAGRLERMMLLLAADERDLRMTKTGNGKDVHATSGS